MKKFFTRSLALMICTLMIFAMFPITSGAAYISAINITLTDAGENLDLHTPLQKAFIDGPYENVLQYASGTSELSQPAPIYISWRVTRNGNVDMPSKYTIRMTENPDMTGGFTYSTSQTSANIYNLKPGTRYYWTVSASVDGITYTSNISTFSTDSRLPYNYKIGGVTNVRDLGGYPTTDGGRVKFDMLYRTGRLNENFSTNPVINSSGINTMKNEMHIRSEIDLRASNDGEYGGRTTSALGSDVHYYLCPMGYSGNILDSYNYASIKKVFNYLGNASNYPMIFHCSLGTDRTGLIAYLVNGLLGVSESDLFFDYLFSNFGNIGSARLPQTMNSKYPMLIKRYYGATLSDKIYNFLSREVGVPTSTLNNIIALLKEYPADPVRTGISTPEQFAAMAPGGDYILTADLTVDSTYTQKFTGSIDGAGHTLTTSAPLFADFCGSIKNITIDGSIETDGTDAAALTLTTAGMKVENVTNNASVTLPDNSGSFCAGGFAARATAGNVYFRSCVNNGDINSCGEAGGFIGLCNGELSIYDCVNNGSVTVTKAVNCGGIVSETKGGVCIEKCFNFGDITGAGTYTAGIAARIYENSGYPNQKTLSAVGNYGSVTGAGSYVSGLIGQITAVTGSLTYSYNLGKITGSGSSPFVTGLVANFSDTTFNISRCYNAGSISAPNASSPKLCQLFHTESTTIDTNLLYRDYAVSELGVPAFCRKNSSGTYTYQNAVSGNATAIPFTCEDLFNGALRTAVNGSVAVYTQTNAHASMTENAGKLKTGVWKILGNFYSFNNGTYAGKLARTYTGLYTEDGDLYYAENGASVGGWKTVGESTYYFDPQTGIAVTGEQTIDGVNYIFDENGILIATEPVVQASVSVENYTLTVENAQDVNFIRIAKGDLNTAAEIKNAPGCISINESVIESLTDENGNFHYELPDGGVWSVWYRYDGGTADITSGLDNTVMTQTVDTYGVTMTVNNLYGVKDFFVGRGHYTTYREVKNADGSFGITSTKINGAHSFTYGAAVGDPGEYTICIRYDDGRPDAFLYFNTEVITPTVEIFGKNLTVGNIDDIRVIRVAPGTYNTAGETKNADGCRNFTAGTIAKLGFTDSLTVNNAANEDGSDTLYTVSIEYRNLYTEIHNITINKLMPSYTVNGNSITFTNLDGLDILRYAPGIYSTPTDIKNAAGSRYVKGANVTDGTVTLNGLNGTYTFLVQYTENSRNVFQTNIPE